MNRITAILLQVLPLVLWLATPHDCLALGQTQYVETTRSRGSFPVCAANSVAAICVDTNDFAGVLIAANNLQGDISHVTGMASKVPTARIIPVPMPFSLAPLAKAKSLTG